MKKSLLCCFFLCFAFFAHGQNGTNAYGISYGEGNGQIKGVIAMAKRFDSTSEGRVGFLDFSYTIGRRKHSAFETGISFLKHDFTYRLWSDKSMTTTTSERSMYSLIIPLKLRFNILKYFFVSGGLLAHLNLHNDGINTLGIGESVGIGIGGGVQYYHRNKYGIFIYPQVHVHSLGFGLIEQHTSFGLSYRLTKN